jgi:hypothetical protein
MSLAVRFGCAAALLFAACSLDVASNTRCNVDTDCIAGYVCLAKRCGRPVDGGGGTGGGGTSGAGHGGSVSRPDGGFDGPPVCPTAVVNVCPTDASSTCEETACGGPVWQAGMVPSMRVSYRILDPSGMFSQRYVDTIHASAAAWSHATGQLLAFNECTACLGHFISVVPGDADGIISTAPSNLDAEQILQMPVDSTGRISAHRIAHQWGHALGLSHTYQRADRDRYVGFNPDIWCSPPRSGLPPRCAAGAASPPGLPAVTTGTFGVFDGKSKMNGLRSEGVCGAEEPDEGSFEPTLGDVSALAELFFSATGRWSPFRPVGHDYQVAPGVDPTGSPAIAEVDYANPEIFVRGTDDHVYRTARREAATSPTAEWLDWEPVADDVDADPAVVFAWLASPETLFLAVRSRTDGQIHLRARRAGHWGAPTSLAAPPVGAASAPALASQSPYSLAVLVRGSDGLIYMLACTDADNDCAASASQPTAWKALPPPPSQTTAPATFVGKPSAIWTIDASGLRVAAVRNDRSAFLITGIDTATGSWIPATTINADLAHDDPGVAISIVNTTSDVAFFARNGQGLLLRETMNETSPPIGGVLASPPSVVAMYQGVVRTDVAALIDDHGHPGVWWRYNDAGYAAPCYSAAAAAACPQCGP